MFVFVVVVPIPRWLLVRELVLPQPEVLFLVPQYQKLYHYEKFGDVFVMAIHSVIINIIY